MFSEKLKEESPSLSADEPVSLLDHALWGLASLFFRWSVANSSNSTSLIIR